MFRTFCISLLGLFCFSQLSAQFFVYQPYNLRGDVMQLFEATGTIIGVNKQRNEYELGGFKTSKQVHFREDGQVAQENRLREGQYKWHVLDFVYTDDRLDQITFQDLMVRQEYLIPMVYDNKGRLQQSFELIRGDTGQIATFTYRRGRLATEQLEFRPPYQVVKTIHIQWDDGRRVTSEEWNEEGELAKRGTYYYNEQGDESAIYYYNEAGALIDSVAYEYTYDHKGNWTSCRTFYAAKGSYAWTTRRIIYRDEEQWTGFAGRWVRGDRQVVLKMNSDGKGALIDLEEAVDVQCEWGPGRTEGYELEPGDVHPISFSSKWNNNREFSMEVVDGVLELSRDEDGYMVFFPYRKENTPSTEWKVFDIALWESLSRPTRWERDKGNYGPELNRIAAQFEDFEMLDQQFARGRLGNQYALVHASTGTIITDANYDYIRLLAPGLFKVQLDGQYGVIDNNGREVLPTIYDQVRSTTDGRIGASKDRLGGYFNYEGEVIVPMEYEAFRSEAFNRLIVEKDRQNALLDFDGNVLVPRGTYSTIRALTPNRFVAVSHHGWGLLDSMGAVVLSPQYDRLEEGTFGFLKAWQNNRFLLLDMDGNVLAGPFDDLAFCVQGDSEPFKCYDLGRAEAVAKYRQGSEWGYVNGLGQSVPPRTKPDRLLNYLFEELDKPSFSLRYPKGWGLSAQSIVSENGGRYSVTYVVAEMGSSYSEWIENLGTYGERRTFQVEGESIPGQLSITGSGRDAQRVQRLFYPVANGMTLVLSFHCPNRNLTEAGQYFYDIAASVEIK